MASLIDIKTQARRAIHGRLAVPCTYRDADHPTGLNLPEGVSLTVRYHTKIDTTGDLDGNYGSIIDGIDRLVFHDENVAEVNAALYDADEPLLDIQREAEITIEGYQGLTFVLDSKEPPDGPAETKWVVARKRV